MAKQQHDARTDPEVPKGMSIELLKDLHLLTRDGQLNADARRKLKQIRHLVGLLKPALDDSLERSTDPLIVDCGAGKSYLGALLYELVLGPAGRGSLVAIEARPELSEQAAARATRFGQDRFRVATGAIATAPPAEAKTGQGVLWKYGMVLKARPGGVAEFAKATRLGVEVYQDGNTGNLLYLAETGSIAVLPKK